MSEEPADDAPDFLTEDEHAALKEWIRTVRSYVALDGWHVELSRKACPDPDATASTFITDEADRVTLYLGPKWRAGDAAERKRTIIHELLHPRIHRVTRLTEELLGDEISPAARRILRESTRYTEERTVDALAFGLSPLFPELP